MKKNRFPVMTVALAAAALLGITVCGPLWKTVRRKKKRLLSGLGFSCTAGMIHLSGHSGVPWSRMQRSMNRRRGSG